MAAVTGTLAEYTEFSGKYKAFKITFTPASASDTITLTTTTHKLRTILQVIPVLTGGIDANLLTIHATFSGLVITVVTKGADGLAATDWTGATAELLVIGK